MTQGKNLEITSPDMNYKTANQSTAPLISIEELSFEYVNMQTGEHIVALEDINLTIKTKEFVSIVGSSGCGKTTLLKQIAGLLRPTKGRILVDGKQVTGPDADRGLVFQEYALLPWKTVRENIELGPKLRGVGKDARSELADEYINLVGLSGFEDKYPFELSGGMSQRVAVARTLANSPKVMLMDEPFAAVDAQTRAALQEELTRIWEQHRLTVVFVTHNVDESIFLGDRVVVLSPRPGKIRANVLVNIPREDRNWLTLESDSKFLDIKTKISNLLR